MTFIPVTIKHSNKKIWINPRAISAIGVGEDGETMICIVGDNDSHYVVAEPVDCVMRKIQGAAKYE